MSDVSRETRSLALNNALGSRRQAAGRRRCVRHGGTLCSRCLEKPPSKGDSYCAACRSIINKDWRRRHAAELQRLRALARGETPSIEGVSGQDEQQKNQQRDDEHGEAKEEARG